LELRKTNFREIRKALAELSELRTPYIELRIFEALPFKQVLRLLEQIQSLHFKQLTILVKHTAEWTIEQIEAPFKYMTVIGGINVFNSPENKQHTLHQGTTTVNYTTKLLSNCSCGVTNPAFFYPNLSFYEEAKLFNSCLNRKIAIDGTGEIKNCPSIQQSYGNIKDKSLLAVISQKRFQQVWDITKNQIHTCKACEFRDICQDCRAYLSDPNDIYSKPLKCGYNPYTNEWADWSSNPLSKAAIVHYGLTDQ
jgi:SPASM domain peptide maturase of grasp-with-spasm system